MDTRFRDDAIAKNRLALKLTFLWALLSSMSLILVTLLCFYGIKHQNVRWLPLCGVDFEVGDLAYSPSYLQEMAKKVADLRLTYNPETVASRFNALVHLAPINKQEPLKKVLDQEIKTIIRKNISSVFYSQKISVDIKHHQANIEGELCRLNHGLEMKPEHKTYLLTFTFKDGLLSPDSIKDITHD